MQVALFPIPEMVAFPGTIVPLHIFEPRYRTMIQDSVEQSRMIAVCHTRKEIRAAKQHQTITDALSSNQATYEPYNVFSAGLCEISETTDDGRIYANITMSVRLSLIREVQTLPYRIVDCETLEDAAVDESDMALIHLMQAITRQLLLLAGPDNLPLKQVLEDNRWTELPASQFSFKVFQFLRFESEIMQELLELTDASERLTRIHDFLDESLSR